MPENYINYRLIFFFFFWWEEAQNYEYMSIFFSEEVQFFWNQTGLGTDVTSFGMSTYT